MRHSWRTRLFAASYSLWLLVVLGGLPMLQVCPIHSSGHDDRAMGMGGMSMGGMAMGGMPMGGMAMGDMPMGGMAHASHDGPADVEQPPAKQHSPESCSFFCYCCNIGPTALPARRVITIGAATIRMPTPDRPWHVYVAGWSDFVLPFSTAPPATA